MLGGKEARRRKPLFVDGFAFGECESASAIFFKRECEVAIPFWTPENVPEIDYLAEIVVEFPFCYCDSKK